MKCIQMLKGESSYWANKQQILPRKLFWQKEYFAVSVSESGVEKVRAYIDNQEEHHRKMSWQQEYDQIISKFKFNIF